MPVVENPARVLRDFLVAQTVVIDPTATPADGWQATHGKMPPDGDRFVTVYGDETIKQGRIQKTGERVLKYRVLIRVRAPDETAGRAKGTEIENLLDRVGVPEQQGGLGRRVLVVSDGLTYVMSNVVIVTSLSPAQPEPERRRVVFSMTVQLTLNLEE